MAFTVPTFNLSVKIWRNRGTGGSYAAPDLTTVCNLSPGRRVMLTNAGTGLTATLVQYMEILLPKLTDVRADWNGQLGDLLEVPGGSNRFYLVLTVDDIGKGFSNEHRFALGSYMTAGTNVFGVGLHPAPVPMP